MLLLDQRTREEGIHLWDEHLLLLGRTKVLEWFAWRHLKKSFEACIVVIEATLLTMRFNRSSHLFS